MRIVLLLLLLLFALVGWRLETEKTKQDAAQARGHRRPPPVRVLHLDRRPVNAEREEATPATGPPAHWLRALRSVSLAVVTPLLEKNITKTFMVEVPLVFSMSRVVVLAFAVGVLRQIWRAGVAGWPEAALAIAVVLALPVLGAMERVAPEQVVELAKTFIGRFGPGAVRTTAGIYSADEREPSRYDDHRRDTI